jgi:hypothetical protein
MPHYPTAEPYLRVKFQGKLYEYVYLTDICYTDVQIFFPSRRDSYSFGDFRIYRCLDDSDGLSRPSYPL